MIANSTIDSLWDKFTDFVEFFSEIRCTIHESTITNSAELLDKILD